MTMIIDATALLKADDPSTGFNIEPNAPIEIRDSNGNLAIIYSDESLSAPISQPTNCDANGQFLCYAEDGLYNVTISFQSGNVTRPILSKVQDVRYLTTVDATAENLKVGQYVIFTDLDNANYKVVLSSDAGGFYLPYNASLKFRLAMNTANALHYGVKQGVDSSAEMQALVNYKTSGLIYLPDGNYYFQNIQLHGDLFIGGESKQGVVINGDGTAPIFKTGTYPGGDLLKNRNISYNCLTLLNSNYPCIQQYTAVNYTINKVVAATSNAIAIDIKFSFRGSILESFIVTNGVGQVALDIADNCNGTSVESVTTSCGSSGKAAISLRQSQGVSFYDIIIETSGDCGLAVGIDSDIGAGNCNGVSIDTVYVENTRLGISCGRYSFVQGLTIKNCFINGEGNVSTASGIELGRVNGLTSESNYIDLVNKGDAYLFRYGDAGSTKHGSNWRISNDTLGAVANLYSYNGTWNDAFKEILIGTSEIDLKGQLSRIKHGLKSKDITILAGDTLNARVDTQTEGGRLRNVKVISAGTFTSGALLTVGSSVNTSEALNVDLSSVTFSSGIYDTGNLDGRVRASTGLLVSCVNNSAEPLTLSLEYNI